MQASDFLQDNVTAAVAAAVLRRAFVPDDVSTAGEFNWELHTPKQAQRDRVSKVNSSISIFLRDHLPCSGRVIFILVR